MSLNHIFKSGEAKMLMRVVNPGEKFGSGMALFSEETEPMVEFYNKDIQQESCPDTGVELGTFVSRYFLADLFPLSDDPTDVLGALEFRFFQSGAPSEVDGSHVTDGEPTVLLTAPAMHSCKHALMAAGYLPNPEDMVATWISVSEEAPLVVSGTALSYAPLEPSEAGLDMKSGASAWVEVYHGSASFSEAQNEIDYDRAARCEAVAAGDLSDEGPDDFVMGAFVSKNGDVHFVDFGYGVFEIKSARQLFGDFGMVLDTSDVPSP